MNETIMGQLEIDRNRGVVYFHAEDPEAYNRYGTVTVLRISGIPTGRLPTDTGIDLTCKPDKKADN